VLQADGGTRTASITGACVAVHEALDGLVKAGKLPANPMRDFVAAISVGIYKGVPVLDLDYPEDSDCETDMNVVMTGSGGFVEVQGTAEGSPSPAPNSTPCWNWPAPASPASSPNRKGPRPRLSPNEPRHGQLVLASGNAGKLKELSALLAPLGIEVLPQSAFNVSEAEEPHPSFVENAIAKARHAARATGLPALADDSGLCVDVLGGAPGVLSARFAGEPKSDARNNALLLERLAGEPNRRPLLLRWPSSATPTTRSPHRLRRMARRDPRSPAAGRLRLRPAVPRPRPRADRRRDPRRAQERPVPPGQRLPPAARQAARRTQA
jgi:hypothetical protein